MRCNTCLSSRRSINSTVVPLKVPARYAAMCRRFSSPMLIAPVDVDCSAMSTIVQPHSFSYHSVWLTKPQSNESHDVVPGKISDVALQVQSMHASHRCALGGRGSFHRTYECSRWGSGMFEFSACPDTLKRFGPLEEDCWWPWSSSALCVLCRLNSSNPAALTLALYPDTLQLLTS